MLLWAALIAIALRYLIPRWRHRPPNTAVASALRPISGIEPTGADGTWTRRDHLRGAGTSALTSLALFGVAALAMIGGQRVGDTTTEGMILMGIGFGAVLGMAMATVWTLVCLGKAAVTRDSNPSAGA